MTISKYILRETVLSHWALLIEWIPVAEFHVLNNAKERNESKWFFIGINLQ